MQHEHYLYLTLKSVVFLSCDSPCNGITKCHRMLLLATNKLIHRLAMNCATQVWNSKLIEYTVGCIEKADKLQTIIQGLYVEILNSRSDLGVILMGLLNSEIELRSYFQAS